MHHDASHDFHLFLKELFNITMLGLADVEVFLEDQL